MKIPDGPYPNEGGGISIPADKSWKGTTKIDSNTLGNMCWQEGYKAGYEAAMMKAREGK